MSLSFLGNTHVWQRWTSGIGQLLTMDEQLPEEIDEIPSNRGERLAAMQQHVQGLTALNRPVRPEEDRLPTDMVQISIPGSTEVIQGHLVVSVVLGFNPTEPARNPDEQWLVDQYGQQLTELAQRMKRDIKSRFLEELRNPTPHQVAARTQARRITSDAHLVRELRDELIIGNPESALQQFVSRAQHAVTENRGLTTPSENSTLNVETNSDEQPAQISNASGEPARERTT
jgi:hypothetical protein